MDKEKSVTRRGALKMIAGAASALTLGTPNAVAQTNRLNQEILAELVSIIRNLPLEMKQALARIKKEKSIPRVFEIFQEVLVETITEKSNSLGYKTQKETLGNVDAFTRSFMKTFSERLQLPVDDTLLKSAEAVVRHIAIQAAKPGILI